MAIPDQLSCQELIELVTEYLESSLPAAEHARFERHINSCVDCRGYLDQMRRTIQLVGMLCEQDVPADARDHLLRTFRDWKRGE